MKINWKKADRPDELITRYREEVPYLSFPVLEESGMVKHGFSTRYGGVSTGCYESMNLSFSRGDDKNLVQENYCRMAQTLQVDVKKMVTSWQSHTINVRNVTEEDLGKGIWRERDYRDVDGLITNIPGITLVTFYADCVPLYLLDPVHRAIGLSHSGWRGTVNRMGEKTLDAMSAAFGTRAEDVIACIGPSICKSCFEVGENLENTSWICGKPMRSYFGKQAFCRQMSTPPISAPCAIQSICILTGLWAMKEAIWLHSCA